MCLHSLKIERLDALNVLQESLDSIRANRGFVIVRICYDPWYNGRSTCNRSVLQIVTHVANKIQALAF